MGQSHFILDQLGLVLGVRNMLGLGLRLRVRVLGDFLGYRVLVVS
jgi:hypothetical protein